MIPQLAKLRVHNGLHSARKYAQLELRNTILQLSFTVPLILISNVFFFSYYLQCVQYVTSDSREQAEQIFVSTPIYLSLITCNFRSNSAGYYLRMIGNCLFVCCLTPYVCGSVKAQSAPIYKETLKHHSSLVK